MFNFFVKYKEGSYVAVDSQRPKEWIKTKEWNPKRNVSIVFTGLNKTILKSLWNSLILLIPKKIKVNGRDIFLVVTVNIPSVFSLIQQTKFGVYFRGKNKQTPPPPQTQKNPTTVCFWIYWMLNKFLFKGSVGWISSIFFSSGAWIYISICYLSILLFVRMLLWFSRVWVIVYTDEKKQQDKVYLFRCI